MAIPAFGDGSPIYKDSTPVELTWNGGTAECYLWRMGGADIPAGVTVTIEVYKDGEWKTGGITWEAGQANEIRSFLLNSGNKIRAVVTGGALPTNSEIRVSKK